MPRTTSAVTRGGWPQIAVACVLVGLVAGLAVLQYRWMGQVADAERQRMQASVQARAGQFADELDREVSSLAVAFSHVAPPPDSEIDYATAFADDYGRWAATTTHPRLVRALFLVQEEPAAAPSVRKFVDGTFRPVEPPAALDAVRGRLRATADDKLRVFTLGFDAQIPALIVPVARVRVSDVSASPRRLRIMNFAGVTGCLVIELDRGYLGRDWFPALARRYFDGSAGFDYNVAVVDSASRSFIYSSDPRLTMAVFARPDAKVPVFQVRRDQVNRLYVGRSVGKMEFTAKTVEMNIALQEHVSGAATAAPQWQLLLAHRAGSLEAAVAQSRRRNLAVSFGILALLAASLTLIVLSSRRAARLARQEVEFVAGVSHELRTPLSVICSAAENLSDGVVADQAQVQRYGALIHAEGRRLAAMVEQVMAFAGLHAGREIGQREMVSVEDLIGRALEATAPAIAQAGITVERQLARDLPPVRANARAIQRALQNLIDNAIKYGGEARWIRVSAQRTPGGRPGVAIGVEDKGLGVPADEQRRLFEPFFRGRDVATSAIHGSGLGLSLVKGIVEAHGGSVSVRSTSGRGSLFTIQLPAAEQSRESSVGAGAEEHAG